MKVYVLVWNHNYGDDVYVFTTRERAEEKRRLIAEEWFDKECVYLDKPEDRDELAAVYFEETQEYESCWISECDLEY